MRIELAKPNDAPYISLLGRVTFRETFGHLFKVNEELITYIHRTFNVQKIRESLKKPNNVYWLAYVDELPVGFAKLKLNSPSPFLENKDVCQLQKIYVLKDFLSLGIGHALQGQLLAHAKEKGAPNIWLSVLKTNERAVSFYVKNGFTLLGDHDFRIGSQVFHFQAMGKGL